MYTRVHPASAFDSPFRIAIGLSLALGLAAQERIEVDARATSSEERQLPKNDGSGIEASGPFQDAFTSERDVPDFAPSEDIIERSETGELRINGIRRKGNPYVLSMASRDFVPDAGIDARLLAAAEKDPAGHTYGYIMIRGALGDPRKARRLRNLGIEIFGPHTYQSFQVRIPCASLGLLSRLPFVHWVGYALPEQKIEPGLARALRTAKATDLFRIDISVFETDLHAGSKTVEIGAHHVGVREVAVPFRQLVPNGRFHRALVAAGFQFESYTDIDNVHIFRGLATRGQIAKVRDLDFVAFMESVPVHMLYHDQSMAMIGQDRVRQTYDGGTITIGVIDSGLQSSGGTRHRDLASKYLYGISTTGGSPFFDACGHGTHVAGTMTGDGVANQLYRGAAPGLAQTRVTSLRVGRFLSANAAGQCVGMGSVSAHYTFMSTDYVTYGIKPRVINNSWGADNSSGWSGADAGSRTLDGFVYSYDQCYVFAAGNSGAWVGSPAVAKNALTVGGVIDRWIGSANPGDSYTPTGSGTTDGRMKPEVLAPAQWVTSCGTANTSAYLTFQGTSMAAPHMTGALASLIQHYPSTFSYRVPSLKSNAIASGEWQGNPGAVSGSWGSTAGGGAGLGHGLMNAASMHGSSRVGFSTGIYSGELTSTGQSVFWDVSVPANAQHVKLVSCFIETAASSGATQARQCDIRTFIDIPPYSTPNNTGEFGLASSLQTVLSIASLRSNSTGLCALAAGKTVRVKMYGTSIPAGARAKVGFTINWHVTHPTTPTPELTITSSTSTCRPGDSITVTGTMDSPSNGDDMDSARIYPVALGGFVATELSRLTADNILHSYIGSSHPSYPYPSLTAGMTVGQGTSRSLTWRLTAPTSNGNKVITLAATVDPGSVNPSDAKTICVDGLDPFAPTALASTTHTPGVWSSNQNISFSWTPGADDGCAGLIRQRYAIGRSACPTPTTSGPSTQTSASFSSLTETTSSTGHFFAVRSEDKAGNIGDRACVGPFLIDLGNPTISSFSIADGATYTTSLSTTLKTTATDTGSGVHQMRFSNDGSSYSPWQAYSTSTIPWSMNNSFGGSTTEGTRTVYCRVRDAAGNVRTTTDTIEFDGTPPVITSFSIDGGSNYTTSLTTSLKTVATDTASGVDEMRFSNDGSSYSPWQSYSTSPVSWSLDNSYGGNTNEGTRTVYCQVRDAAGNVQTANDTIEYDKTAPTITSFQIDGGANFATGLNVSLATTATDTASGVDEMRFSNDGSSYSPWQSYSTSPVSWSLDNSYGGNANEGTRTVYCQVRDAAGNVQTASDTIEYDKTAPTITSFQIDGGANYTTSLNTTLKIVATDTGSGIHQMRFSNDGSSYSPWQNYSTNPVSWSLNNSYGGSTAEGIRTVYCRVRDRAGNVRSTSDTIEYDVTAPVINSFEIDGGASLTASLNTSLQVTATDAGSGLDQMRFSNDGSSYSPWQTYSTSPVAWSLNNSYGGSPAQGVRTVYCQVRDRASNIQTGSDTIDYDITAPSVATVAIDGGASHTSSLTVSVLITGSGNPTEMQYSNDDSTWSPWAAFTTSAWSASLSMFGGNTNPGVKSVFVRVRDLAGNVSGSLSDTIHYLRSPQLTGGSVLSLGNVTRDYYQLTGVDLTGVDRVSFGTTNIATSHTTANDDWWNTGAYHVVSDTELRIYPPQGQSAGSYAVRAHNPAASSSSINVDVVYPSSRLFYSNANLTAGKPLSFLVTQATEPATTPGLVVFSTDLVPSVLPNVVSLDIGNNFSTLLQMPILTFNSNRCIHITAPTLLSDAGLKIYFECVYMRNPLPLPTTNSWKLEVR